MNNVIVYRKGTRVIEPVDIVFAEGTLVLYKRE
jgi:hypothetical protein